MGQLVELHVPTTGGHSLCGCAGSCTTEIPEYEIPASLGAGRQQVGQVATGCTSKWCTSSLRCTSERAIMQQGEGVGDDIKG